MPRLSALLILFASTLAACTGTPTALEPPVAAPDSTRVLTSGPVTGFINPRGGHAWLGIPYAAPPVGALRWHAPQAVASWETARPALQASAPCVQFGWALGGVGTDGSHQGSEDCLYLNVYAPRLQAGELATTRLPVMLWIHGGANTVGHAAFYDGGHLAETQHVIVVMPNYRLGPFGWFVVPGQTDPEGIEASGNWGNLDTLAALKWVHANATAFGGDPNNVTVFGESAGATNALALLISPLSAGLLHRVIIESLGFGFAPYTRALNYVDDTVPGHAYSSGEVLLKLLVQSGRAATRADARALVATWTPAAIGTFLRELDPWVVYAAYEATNIDADLMPTVFQDGAVVRAGDPLSLLAQSGTHLSIPTLIGSNRDENKLFMAFDSRLVRKVAGFPVWAKDHAAYDREATYRSAWWKTTAVDELASALTKGGADVYAYRWDWRDEGRRFGLVDISQLLGAAHGLEIPFVFGNFDVGAQGRLLYSRDNAPARIALSEAMITYWTQFARSGKPTPSTDALPVWQPWTDAPDVNRLLVFDTDAHGGIRMSNELVTRQSVITAMANDPLPEAERCALFRHTFRWKYDPWADAAWTQFLDGRCAAVHAARID